MTKNLKISEYIDSFYREYSIYTINNRAIPSIIDGFKPVQRKIIYCANKAVRSEFKKVSSFAGLLPNMAAYHHGDSSSQDAIIKMSQDFDKNVPFLKSSGSFGSRLVPVASAPRYIFSKLHDNFDLFFKDNDLVPLSLDKDDHPEPLYYLPIIPTVLLNGVSGVSVGYKTEILPRSPKELTKSCIEFLTTGKAKRVNPWLKNFRGKFLKDGPNRWNCIGKFEHLKGAQYRITEIPIGITHEKYIEHLMNLREKGEITRYLDESDERYDITVVLSPKNYSISDEDFTKLFKLSKPITEIMWFLQDFNYNESDVSSVRIVRYEKTEEIIKDFCEFRIGFYDVRIKNNIDRLNRDILLLDEKIRFLKEVIKGTILVNKLDRKGLVNELKKKSYTEDNIENLISIPIYAMTKDNIDKWTKLIKDKKAELKKWKSSNKLDLYLEDLNELLNKL